jgi:hypothetical protein
MRAVDGVVEFPRRLLVVKKRHKQRIFDIPSSVHAVEYSSLCTLEKGLTKLA